VNGKKQNSRVTERRNRKSVERMVETIRFRFVMCLFMYWYDWSLPIYLVK